MEDAVFTEALSYLKDIFISFLALYFVLYGVLGIKIGQKSCMEFIFEEHFGNYLKIKILGFEWQSSRSFSGLAPTKLVFLGRGVKTLKPPVGRWCRLCCLKSAHISRHLIIHYLNFTKLSHEMQILDILTFFSSRNHRPGIRIRVGFPRIRIKPSRKPDPDPESTLEKKMIRIIIQTLHSSRMNCKIILTFWHFSLTVHALTWSCYD